MSITYADFKSMHEFMRLSFIAAGVPDDEARICADVLIESDKRGIDSHGVGRFKPIYIDRIRAGILSPITKIDILKETPTTAVLDGNDGMGQVIGVKAMEMAMHKAKTYGISMVAVRNSSHYGMAGYYPVLAAKQDLLCITGTNARPSIAPTFGVENMLGTNPLTIGFPTDENFPFVIDCATSISQRGKIEHYARLGKTMPAGWVSDGEGNAVTDPDIALTGLVNGTCALAPLGGLGDALGGYKGYGYATVVEILSSALAGGIFLKSITDRNPDGTKRPYHLGHFFIVADIAAFTDPQAFRHTAGEILRQLRASRRAKGQERIYTAGEKEYLAYLERKEKGIPINREVRKALELVREELHVPYTFPWET
ncbi:MAG: Ldh family oxidoreductase [Candidatus Pelethousia sp.]|nr:Ldh family oxidoreductase [Candidatus Pelethousia sp.]